MTGYSLSVIKTKDNEVFSGIIKHSSAEQLVIAGPGDIRHLLAKSDIKDHSTSPVSMMPSNLYATLSKDEFSNLIAYLENLKDKSSTERNTQGTPAEIERLAAPIKLTPSLRPIAWPTETSLVWRTSQYQEFVCGTRKKPCPDIHSREG